jgi:hypothetical protein
VGSGVISPCSHLKPRQRKPVRVAAGKKIAQLQFSLSGSGSSVCEMPVTSPRTFLTGQRTTLFRSGLPSVPRSVTSPSRHRVAWRTRLPCRFERPATQPRLLMLKPALEPPPSEGSGATS